MEDALTVAGDVTQKLQSSDKQGIETAKTVISKTIIEYIDLPLDCKGVLARFNASNILLLNTHNHGEINAVVESIASESTEANLIIDSDMVSDYQLAQNHQSGAILGILLMPFWYHATLFARKGVYLALGYSLI